MNPEYFTYLKKRIQTEHFQLSKLAGNVDINVKGIDTGSIDVNRVDAGGIDVGSIDAGSIDVNRVDAGSIDAGSIDVNRIDADTGSIDATTKAPETKADLDAEGKADAKSNKTTEQKVQEAEAQKADATKKVENGSYGKKVAAFAAAAIVGLATKDLLSKDGKMCAIKEFSKDSASGNIQIKLDGCFEMCTDDSVSIFNSSMLSTPGFDNSSNSDSFTITKIVDSNTIIIDKKYDGFQFRALDPTITKPSTIDESSNYPMVKYHTSFANQIKCNLSKAGDMFGQLAAYLANMLGIDLSKMKKYVIIAAVVIGILIVKKFFG